MLILILVPVACLLPPGTGAGEIICGHEAKPHSRPYMAYLEIRQGNKRYTCGGFLVSKNFVLTAAHCNGDITVLLGAHNINKQEQSQQWIRVCRPIPHWKYNRETLNNDIMLLQLERAVALNRNISVIPLPPSGQKVRPGTVCSVAGWGRTNSWNNETSPTLQEVDLKVQDNEACWNVPCLRPSYYNPLTMICAGDRHRCQNSFQGDSGGPLVCEGKAQGIVSWGSPFGIPPSVYTRVATFIPWIHEMMKRSQSGDHLGIGGQTSGVAQL
ncbi:mast cell protease 1A-like isoform X2 [Carettochelys insculpta]|uniref:mast cell protease 1A-like isoform X2 n=1 Tax=Carettochelys insculpta TaxID=44489 RepID=UPI003EBC2D7D